MFNLFKANPKEKNGSHVNATFKISGMHCVSCSMNIDDELEGIAGIVSSTTSYAKGQTKIEFDPNKISIDKIHTAIQKLGYDVLL